MNVDLVLRNYRCFPDSSPARFTVQRGFTSFVGANNSGKSSLLRFFFEFRTFLESLSGPTDQLMQALRGGQSSVGLGSNVADYTEVFSNDNSRPMQIEIGVPASTDADSATKITVELVRSDNLFRVTELHNRGGAVPPGPDYQFRTANDGLWLITGRGERIVKMDSIFASIRMLASTVYLGSFRNAINIGGASDYFDIPVGEQFLQAWKGLKGGRTKAQANAAMKLTDDIRQIFDFNALEINIAADDRTLQVFVDRRPFRLDELGSGLAQFILVLAAVATRPRDLILIDEPELNLHPSLQISFVTTLATYATTGVMLGTHNIGLARAIGDSIYSLRRIREGVSQLAPFEKLSSLPEFLGELSFSGYQALGFEKVLLVEGPHDVTAVQQFLRKRGLDHKIVLLPLGGSSMINGNRLAELTELKRISNNIHALIDSERASAGEALAADRQGFVARCLTLGIPCHVLDYRAIENYFPEAAIKAVMGASYRGLTPFERLKDAKPSWGKQDNWRIARDMALDDLNGTDLGEFIKSL
jgi:predicted ATPase